jgi:ABC-type uncharacterized transport system permease subunit
MARAGDHGHPWVGIVLAALVGVVFGMFGFWLNDQQKEIDYVTAVASNNSVRLTSVETRQTEVIEEIRRRLSNIETELRNRD